METTLLWITTSDLLLFGDVSKIISPFSSTRNNQLEHGKYTYKACGLQFNTGHNEKYVAK